MFFSRPMNKGDEEDFDSDWVDDKDAMPNGAANRRRLQIAFSKLRIPIIVIEIVADLIFKELVQDRKFFVLQGASRPYAISATKVK